jgi:hypothetical protein
MSAAWSSLQLAAQVANIASSACCDDASVVDQDLVDLQERVASNITCERLSSGLQDLGACAVRDLLRSAADTQEESLRWLPNAWASVLPFLMCRFASMLACSDYIAVPL